MNALFNAAVQLEKKLTRIETFSHFDFSSFDPPNIEGSNVNEALSYCSSEPSGLRELCCLIIADTSGLINTLDTLEIARYKLWLAQLAHDFGLFSLAKETSHRGIAELPKNRTWTSEFKDKFLLVIAKADRALGRYQDAFSTYRHILMNSWTSGDNIMIAYVLLMMGKTAHNHQWRTGYYRHLVSCAKDRLNNLYAHGILSNELGLSALLEYLLAICYDILVEVEFDMARTWESKDLTNINQCHLEELLKRAEELSKRAGKPNQLLRVGFRSAFIRFYLTKERKTQLSILEEYRNLMLEQEQSRGERRGLGVRYGQFGRMLLAVEQWDEACHYLRKAKFVARQLSDWRTLAANALQLARWAFLTGHSNRTCGEYFREALGALRELQRLDDFDSGELCNSMHPEIEVAILQEKARQLYHRGDYVESMHELDKARCTLQLLESRLLQDYNGFTDTKEGTPLPESKILTEIEWEAMRNSLMVDYQLFSAQMRQIHDQLQMLASISARHESEAKQLDVLFHHSTFLLHRLKNIQSSGIEQIGESIQFLKSVSSNEDCTVHILKIHDSIQGVFSYISKWREEVEQDVDNLRRLSSDVIVQDVLESVQSLRFELEQDPNLNITVDKNLEDNPDRFVLRCYRPLFEDTVITLVENSARILREGPRNRRKEIVLRAYTSIDLEFGKSGFIEIEDSAGRVEDLAKGLVNSSGGLYLTRRFFERFNAKLSAVRACDGNTILRITIPPGRYVQLGR
ncbi:MAG TPA: hypothetical protein VK503_09340 [Candidatus Bathyarchaeia archaeon]|nr:hypothetical protein [Candidatus Bathyarchaeia archaeon]